MKNINIHLLVGFSCFLIMTSPVSVHARGRSSQAIDYLARNPSMSQLSAGAYVGQVEREISVNNSPFTSVISSRRTYAYAGYDVLRWLNVYGVIGMNEAKLQGGSYADSELLFGAGITANLLNHFIREPMPMEDTFRIHANAQAISTQADFGLTDVVWQEISANLTFSLINHIIGNKEFLPEAIAIYAGPSLSYIQSSDVDSENDFGLTGGLEIYFYDSFSLDINFEIYEESTLMAGLNFNF